MATVQEIKAELSAWPTSKSAAYCAKQIHAIPNAPVVDRESFILQRVRGKKVLEFGASGPLHDAIWSAASEYRGVDRKDVEERHVEGFDLDDIRDDEFSTFPHIWFRPDVIICGEVIEHLSNPGRFLSSVHGLFESPLIVTVPNAFSEANQQWLRRGQENVNRDHVAWYSPRTLKTLLERAGYRIAYLAWYKGQPGTAEGIVVIAESA